MGRIVEIEGLKYDIGDASMRIPFTDDNGKTYEFDSLMFHNPLFHQTYRFTTILSVLKWWVRNRAKFMQTLRDYDMLSFALDRVEMYFDYISQHDLWNEDLGTMKERLTGYLYTSSLRYHFNGSSPSSEFILLDKPESEQEVPRVDLAFMYLARVEVNLNREASSATGDKWDKHYNYSFQMDPSEFNWYRSVSNESNVMFGMELEVSSKLSTQEIQQIVREVEPKQEPFFIFKQDSSISGKYRHALEMVTVPCSPRYLRKNWKVFFQKIEKLCRSKGMEVGDVFDTRRDLSNGLHIHVSKDSFLDRPHFNKFLTAWNQWSKSVTKLFNAVADRPTDYTKNSYCPISRTHEGLVLARRLKGIRCRERMSVAHDSNSNTIEVRVYQGIVDLPHIMRCISFTEAMFEFCKSIGYSNFDARFVSSMSKFVRSERRYASLYSIFEKAAAK